MSRFALFIAVLSCCTRRVETPAAEAVHDLVVTEEDCEGAPEEFTAARADVLADLDVVERIVRDGWAGFDERTKQGVDWKATFAALRAGVEQLPDPVPADTLRRYLADGLHAADDSHLSFWWVDARGKKHSSSTGGRLEAWTSDGGAGEGLFLVHGPKIEKRPLKLAAASPGPEWRRLVGGHTPAPDAGAPLDTLSSDVTEQGQLNVAICAAARPDLDREERLALARQRDALRLSASRFRAWLPARGAYDGPRVLLVDRRCAAACESRVTFARRAGATIVGENTAQSFGEPLEYRLPRTGLWMRASATWIIGLEPNPDYWIDDADPEGLARELAEHPIEKN